MLISGTISDIIYNLNLELTVSVNESKRQLHFDKRESLARNSVVLA